jgi:hypothetical protein
MRHLITRRGSIRRFSARSRYVRNGVVGASALITLSLCIAPSTAAASPGSTALSGHCPATRAPQLSASNPWRRNGWLSARNEALSAHLDSDQPYLSRRGILLTEWEPDSMTGKIKVYLRHYSARAAQAMYARYGCAISVAKVSEPLGHVLGRGDDAAPYFGGDFIFVPGGAPPGDVGVGCSGGPIVLNSAGEYRMLTAGHCTGALGNFVYRSDRDGQTNGPHMGNVTQRSWCNGCLDGAVVDNDSSGSGYLPSVWGGGDGGTPAYLENGIANPQPNLCPDGVPGCPADLVANDSAVSGEIDGLIVEAFNADMNVQDPFTGATFTLVHLSKATGSPGQVIAHEGDSGGPWIVRNGSSGTASIAGTTSACNDAAACTTVYFTEIGYLQTKFDFTVPVG